MSNSPSVSVLITVYNRERYLGDCLASLLASTFSDWEAIVVDDASSDESVAVAHNYAARDARIHVFENAENLGDYPNRNKASEYARGRYLKYLDSDDTISPDGLDTMVAAMDQHPEAALGLSHTARGQDLPLPACLSAHEVYEREFLGRGVLGCGPSAAIIRRDVFEDLGRFSPQRYLGDRDMWYRLTQPHPLVLIREDLIQWRRHETQEFALGQANGHYLIATHALRMRVLNDPHTPLPEDARRRAMQRERRHQARRALSIAVHGSPRLALTIMREAKLSMLDALSGLRPYTS